MGQKPSKTHACADAVHDRAHSCRCPPNRPADGGVHRQDRRLTSKGQAVCPELRRNLKSLRRQGRRPGRTRNCQVGHQRLRDDRRRRERHLRYQQRRQKGTIRPAREGRNRADSRQQHQGDRSGETDRTIKSKGRPTRKGSTALSGLPLGQSAQCASPGTRTPGLLIKSQLSLASGEFNERGPLPTIAKWLKSATSRPVNHHQPVSPSTGDATHPMLGTGSRLQDRALPIPPSDEPLLGDSDQQQRCNCPTVAQAALRA